MSRRASKKKPRPATQAERDAIHFEAVEGLDFNCTNDEWANANLPLVRVAVAMLGRNDVAHQSALASLMKTGVVPDMLDDMVQARENFKALAQMIDIALHRSFLVLERLGYTPENPPPDSVVH